MTLEGHQCFRDLHAFIMCAEKIKCSEFQPTHTCTECDILVNKMMYKFKYESILVN